ncbi:hypothetical protein LMG28614_07230 [Paraburkholderia ultramafica]|uniref:Uncharacterized protein n=1 Tax=Paraburkholderia ultramafica TaxID=1544867 RepID=A0A6S7BS24_9BURK|nr:hypothetical protein [Paraburkholderia ultramafica]CAB3810219.1 hypothetical protein LMG28614_07230 [Paraburkholderia ultramafica]
MQMVIRIDMPPKGIESTEDGFSPTDDQMSEEAKARQEFLDFVGPKLAAFPRRPARRQGNVDRVELLGANVWSHLNHYLLLVSVDIGDPGIDWASLVPPGGEVTIIGSYAPLQHWPDDG